MTLVVLQVNQGLPGIQVFLNRRVVDWRDALLGRPFCVIVGRNHGENSYYRLSTCNGRTVSPINSAATSSVLAEPLNSALILFCEYSDSCERVLRIFPEKES